MRVAAGTMPDWTEWEGECADGEFPLERYLGGSSRSAVFLTSFGSQRAAIKLVRANAARADKLVDGWNRAATLEHPHLLRIFKSGTCVMKGLSLAYVVMEYADEHLATVLAERALTSDETLEMMRPVADVLVYLHRAGLVHGNLKPSNIFAVQDTVKVSSDTVRAGDPAADVFGLSQTMIQALTRWNPATQGAVERAPFEILPEPFDEIARNCFLVEPEHRWTSAEVATRLRAGEPRLMDSGSKLRILKNIAPKGWVGFFSVFALILLTVAAGALVMRRTRTPANAAAAPHLLAPVSHSVSSGTVQAASSIPAMHETAPVSNKWTEQGIVHYVLPDIPSKARKTVRGKATVLVRVGVDSSGNVMNARLDRGSRYFGNFALTAARHWQFAPVDGEGRREWVLRFEITKTAANVVPEQQVVAK